MRAWLPTCGVALAVLWGAGCLQAASHACDLGGVCPEELRCVTSDGADLCVLPTCGNGRVDPGESCDDGNHVSGDGCPANCVTVCGDGRVEGPEVCDDGNTTGGDGCSADCRSNEACGNGILDPGEACDDGHASRTGCSAQCTLLAPTWAPLDAAPAPRTGHATAYDAAHGTVVLFGGRGPAGLLDDTWIWDGAVWRQGDPAVVPPPRRDHAMTYDAARGRVVLFGGGASAEHSTWEWDGVHWIERQPASAPPSQLAGSAMAYDAARRRVVLFGGAQGGIAQNATWEWDGDAWREVATVAMPPPRTGHAMAYDAARERMVLFGGVGDAGRLSDTWEFDGADWALRSVPAPPAARAHAAMAFDAAGGQVVLFGGDGDTGLLDDTWTWDGAGWRAVTPGPAPSARTAAAMVYDALRDQVVLFGGEQLLDPSRASAGLSSETWAWSRAAWSLRTVSTRVPAPRDLGGLVYDPVRGRVVVFGGSDTSLVPNRPSGVFFTNVLDDTWEWDGSTWIADASPIAPSPRWGFAMASDGQRIVLFGGLESIQGSQTVLNDTWLLVDTQWVKQAVAVSPPERFDTAMAYDPLRGKMVLFGGVGSEALADTWEWDGTGWVQRFPVHAPSPRFFPAMAFDAVRGRVLLFGGSAESDHVPVRFDDTWEWDGDDWVQLPTTRAPAPGGGHAIASDPTRGIIVVVDGKQPTVDATDGATWVWDGTDWQQRSPPAGPGQQDGVVMAYDARRDRMVMFGGTRGPSGGIVVSEWDGARWSDVAPVTHVPSERSLAAMVYDPDRASVMMFGGGIGTDINDDPLKQEFNDTWTWNGEAWHEEHPATSPAGSSGHTLAFDTQRHRAVLFGGGGSGTWEWDGTTWLERSVSSGPVPRSGATMVYDEARRQTLLISGNDDSDSNVPRRDLWAWDGDQWIQISSALPFGAVDAAATYDAARRRVVLFGGRPPHDASGNDLWEWDGTLWHNVPATGTWPPPRTKHALAYDPVRRRTVLFGGHDATTFVLNDLWEWDGTSWTQIAPAAPLPLPRMDHVMVYDQARRELVLFGGNDSWKELCDTWLLRYDDPAAPDVVAPVRALR